MARALSGASLQVIHQGQQNAEGDEPKPSVSIEKQACDAIGNPNQEGEEAIARKGRQATITGYRIGTDCQIHKEPGKHYQYCEDRLSHIVSIFSCRTLSVTNAL